MRWFLSPSLSTYHVVTNYGVMTLRARNEQAARMLAYGTQYRMPNFTVINVLLKD